MGGIAYWLLGSLGTAPWAFVVFAAMIFLTWGWHMVFLLTTIMNFAVVGLALFVLRPMRTAGHGARLIAGFAHDGI
jgi:OFA family oxalate/formate antiporter-like MFS transporter